MKLKTVSAVALVLLVASACANDRRGQKETVGGFGGAALGGLIGAQFGSGKGRLAATGAGVLIGALIGSQVGRQLDDADRAKANEAVNEAHDAPIGETITWNNPENGHRGTVTPVRDGTASNGNYCREFQQTVTIGGRTEEAYGTACRQPDGAWKIVQ